MNPKIKENYLRITNTLAAPTKLLAVTKSVGVNEIKELYDLGQRDFGENRVKDLEAKANELKNLTDINWHFIGNLQSKKVKDLLKIKNLKFIHSVDSLSLIDELIKRSENLSANVNIFLQVNTSLEDEKSGFFDSEDTGGGVKKLINSKNDHLKLYGLMTMGKLRTEDFEQAAKVCFKKLKQIKDELNQQIGLELFLSMGMSSDYEIAQEVGTDWVRIGTSLFE